MKKSAWFFGLGLAIAASVVMADEPPAAQPTPAQQKAMQAVRAACETDAQKLCAGVQPGGGRVVACLKEHKDQVSDGCKQAISKAKQNPG
jgi:phage terminase large subunit-like protein